MKNVLLILSLLTACAISALAHEVRPAYLELRQTGTETYTVLWKVPILGDNQRPSVYVELPAGCTNLAEPRAMMVNNALTERWQVKCVGGLTGGTIRIVGLSGTMTDVLVRLEQLDGSTQVTRLTPSAPAFVVEAAPRALAVARTYLVLGVEHILGGIDHLLFVLALLILVKGSRRLIATVTAFTLAHSLTLAGATLGWLHVPGRPVEATIALSIVFVAAEIVHSRNGWPGLTEKFPWFVAFTFGLLHGFGFASALSEVGLPQSAIPVALFCFNVGVEVGQLMFIAAAFAVIAVGNGIARRCWPVASCPQLLTRLQLLPPYAIGSVAMFWVIQRLAAF